MQSRTDQVTAPMISPLGWHRRWIQGRDKCALARHQCCRICRGGGEVGVSASSPGPQFRSCPTQKPATFLRRLVPAVAWHQRWIRGCMLYLGTEDAIKNGPGHVTNDISSWLAPEMDPRTGQMCSCSALVLPDLSWRGERWESLLLRRGHNSAAARHKSQRPFSDD